MTIFDGWLEKYYKTRFNYLICMISLFAIIGALIRIFFFTPVDSFQGIVQKIFYIHLPCAISSFAAFFFVFIFSITYLLTRRNIFDDVASSMAEVGLIFCSLVLLTGPIWAKSAWGTWWTWDNRLTTTLILWILYSGYLMLRNLSLENERGKRVAAVVGIVAFLDIPIIQMSIKWWRTIHPTVLSGGPGNGIDLEMKITLIISTLAFFLFFVTIWIERFALSRSETFLRMVQIEDDFLSDKNELI